MNTNESIVNMTDEMNEPAFNLLEGEEVESRRELHAKHFTFGGGKRQAILFNDPVHYEGEDGKLHEIDSTLQLTTIDDRQVYRNTANPMNIVLPARAD